MAWITSHKKSLTALVVGIIVSLLHLESESDTQLVSKQARLPSERIRAFKYLSELQNMKFWTPGLTKFDPLDNHQVGLGKHYIEAYYIPFYGELEFDCVILGYESPRYISFVCDNWLKTRVQMTLDESGAIPTHPTLMTFAAYSRRRSYFFKYIMSPMVRFYEDASIRRALFSLTYALELS